MKEEKPEYQTTKIWKRTKANLRAIYANTGETQVKILDRLVEAELKKQKYTPQE